MFEQFETERLIVRRLQLSDAEAMYQGWTQDEAVTRYLSWFVHQSIEDTHTFLAQVDRSWRDRSGHLAFGLQSKTSGQLLGGIGFGIEARCRAHVGYAIAQAHWGQGYASEALGGLIETIWRELPHVHRIYGMCHATHFASAGVMLKVGMEKEGIFRRYYILPNISADIPCDMAVYSTIRS